MMWNSDLAHSLLGIKVAKQLYYSTEDRLDLHDKDLHQAKPTNPVI